MCNTRGWGTNYLVMAGVQTLQRREQQKCEETKQKIDEKACQSDAITEPIALMNKLIKPTTRQLRRKRRRHKQRTRTNSEHEQLHPNL